MGRGVFQQPAEAFEPVEYVNITCMKKAAAIPKNVDEYLVAVTEPARGTLVKVRAAIRSAVPPEATEAISYGMPTFRYKGALVGFAAFSKSLQFLPYEFGRDGCVQE